MKVRIIVLLSALCVLSLGLSAQALTVNLGDQILNNTSFEANTDWSLRNSGGMHAPGYTGARSGYAYYNNCGHWQQTGWDLHLGAGVTGLKIEGWFKSQVDLSTGWLLIEAFGDGYTPYVSAMAHFDTPTTTWTYLTTTVDISEAIRADIRSVSVNARKNTTAGAGSLMYDDITVTAVPEPVTIGLLAIGGLVSLRRRRA